MKGHSPSLFLSGPLVQRILAPLPPQGAQEAARVRGQVVYCFRFPKAGGGSLPWETGAPGEEGQPLAAPLALLTPFLSFLIG